jgi:hypothetical protein
MPKHWKLGWCDSRSVRRWRWIRGHPRRQTDVQPLVLAAFLPARRRARRASLGRGWWRRCGRACWSSRQRRDLLGALLGLGGERLAHLVHQAILLLNAALDVAEIGQRDVLRRQDLVEARSVGLHRRISPM